MWLTAAVPTRVPQAAYDVTQIAEGPAMLLIGVLAMLLAAAVALRNPMALGAWGITVLLLVFSGIFGLGFEWVWLGVLATVVLVVLGAVVRWGAV